MIHVAMLLSLSTALVGMQDGKDQSVEAEWRREYPAAVARLEEIAKNFQAKGNWSSRFINGEEIHTNALTVAASGNRRVVVKDKQSQGCSRATAMDFAANRVVFSRLVASVLPRGGTAS